MRKIGIYSAAPGAGAKFTAAALGCYLAAAEGKDPAVLELGQPGLYDMLGMDRRFAGRRFCPPGGPANRAAGVNWQLQLPAGPGLPKAEEAPGRGAAGRKRYLEPAAGTPLGGRPAAPAADFYQRLRLLDHTEGDVILCLLNGIPQGELPLFFREMDRVLCIIDPLPSRLLQSYDGLQNLSRLQPESLWVVNKMNGGVKAGELERFLGKKDLLLLPALPQEDIYRAEYRCCCPYELPAAARRLRPHLARLWAELQQ